MEQIVYLDVSMGMPVTVEISLERVLSPVTGMEALSNAQVNSFFMFYFLYASELSDNIHKTKMSYFHCQNSHGFSLRATPVPL